MIQSNFSRHNFYRQRGFTLFEVLVAVIIVAIIAGMLTFGFEQSLNRRKDADVRRLQEWLQAASDTAVFQSSVFGVVQQENELNLLAYYDDQWFFLAEEAPFKFESDLQLIWSEELQKKQSLQRRRSAFSADRDNEAPEPQLVLMPTGQILPEGESMTFTTEQQQRAIISWDEEARFTLQWLDS